jgi:hypothetical protein
MQNANLCTKLHLSWPLGSFTVVIRQREGTFSQMFIDGPFCLKRCRCFLFIYWKETTNGKFSYVNEPCRVMNINGGVDM